MTLNPMSQALRNRKSSGIDLTIIVGDPDDSDEKELGLAPDATEVTDSDDNEMNEDVVGPGELQTQASGSANPQGGMDPDMMNREIAKLGLGKNSLAGRKGLMR